MVSYLSIQWIQRGLRRPSTSTGLEWLSQCIQGRTENQECGSICTPLYLPCWCKIGLRKHPRSILFWLARWDWPVVELIEAMGCTLRLYMSMYSLQSKQMDHAQWCPCNRYSSQLPHLGSHSITYHFLSFQSFRLYQHHLLRSQKGSNQQLQTQCRPCSRIIGRSDLHYLSWTLRHRS